MTIKLPYIPRGGAFVCCGYKLKVQDLKNSLLKLTDLSGALYSFSIRVLRNEMPRRKLIIEIEMNAGFNPERYCRDTYLHELIFRMKKASRQFREFIRYVPADSFPELHFHHFGKIAFNKDLYRSRNYYIF